jgi:hypothetical protein
MFPIKSSIIRERTTNGSTYLNGRACYRNGQVAEVRYDREKGLILARVEGTQPYQVRIILNHDGSIHETSCTCSAFTSYWGDCKHIAAVLMYCMDHLGEGRPEEPAPSRKSRLKAREFLSQAGRRAQILQNPDRQVLMLHAILTCGCNPSTLPALALQVSNGRLHTVLHIEQFLDALARDLPFEIDAQLTYDPFNHRFDPTDEPLLNFLLDAYEQDYKATFGSAAAARSEQVLILNASRTAAFLRLAAGQPRCCFTLQKSQESWPVRVCESSLPIRLQLVPSPSEEGLYVLRRQNGPALLQLTASRNVYLVQDTFYLPPREAIRLLDPVLALFTGPAPSELTLSEDEVAELAGLPPAALESVCPIDYAPEILARMIREPLDIRIGLSCVQAGLQADLQFCYGSVVLGPFSPAGPKKAGGPIIARDRLTEQMVCDGLEQAGFRRQGPTYQLSEMEAIYRFFDEGLERLRQKGVAFFDSSHKPFTVLPAPDLTVRIAEAAETGKLVVTIAWDGLPPADRPLYLRALREQKPYCITRSGLFCEVRGLSPASFLLPLLDRFESWGLSPLEDQLILPRYRVLELVALSRTVHLDRTGLFIDPELTAMADSLDRPEHPGFRLPPGLAVPLRPYQRAGYNWLCTLDRYGLGGILADDMGLGKTLQSIAYIVAVHRKKRRPSLVIAPTSLVYNWQREFEKFAPDLKVLVYDGNRQQRAALLEQINAKACIITSYALLRRDYPELAEIPFASCFLDEAQNIKNPETLNARSVKQLKADRMFALTGTPIENSLTELWSIFDVLLPGYLGSRRQFELRFESSGEKEQDSEQLAELHRQIRPFILRRMKKDVLRELPDKIETRIVSEMTEEQRELYQACLTLARQSFEQEVAENGFTKSQLYILALLTRLRQICCHPALFRPDYTGESGKLLLLDELIADALASGHRLLIFSQFAQMLQIIRERLRVQGLACFLIDGQVAAEDRLAQVERFNRGEGQIFLVSLRAGGTGLNLTGADTVIHYDPWWNPAVEDQATDRAYRIGQENVVQVFRLYARDTIEEKIQAIQEKKQTLIDSVIKPGQNLLSQMTIEEVRSLFET